MRSWEIILLLLLSAAYVVTVRRKEPARLFLLLPISLLIHLRLEGGRWQMGLAYAFTLWGIAASAAAGFGRYGEKAGGRYGENPGGRLIGERRVSWLNGNSRGARFTGYVCLLLAWVLPYLMPVPQLDPPGGNDQVGTVTYHWTDTGRQELTTGRTDRYRELNVQLWYPAQIAAGAKQAPYIPGLGELGRYAEERSHLPSVLLNYLQLTKTYAYTGAALPDTGESYPVIVLSHGWPGFRFTYHYLAAGLASRGYIVAAPDHTYGASATVFPGGRVEAIDLSTSEFDLPGWDRIIDQVWSEDDSFILDQLEKLNNGELESPFAQRLNLQEAGVMGHSYGGDNALAALRKDKRFKAGISLDGSFYGAVGEPLAPEQSFLWMCTDRSLRELGLPAPNDEELAVEGFDRATYNRWAADFPLRRAKVMSEGGETLQIRGADHSSFSDLYLFSPALRWKDRAPEVRQMHGTVLEYAALFLDERLKGAAPGELHWTAGQDQRVLLNPKLIP